MPVEKIIIGRSKEDASSFGAKGAVYLGKHIVGEGEESHLTNPVYLDVVRPHVVLVSGKRGSGKCVEENTLVALADGSVIPIKDIDRDIDRIQGLDGRLKISSLKATKSFKRKVSKLLKIRTRSGKEIRLTPEHPLLTVKGWEEVKCLGIGSRIATPRKVLSMGNDELDDNKTKILAYLIAEGMIQRGAVRFTNMDPEIVTDFKLAVKTFDKNLRVVFYRDGSYAVSHKDERLYMTTIRDKQNRFVKRNSLKKWLKELNCYDVSSKKKTIPDIIFRLKKRKLALFLNRLFSCDGSIYQHKSSHGKIWEISYSSSSETLIRQVQHLLLRFGVLSRLRYKTIKCNGKDFNVFELTIRTDNISRFINEIGFFGKKKDKEDICLKELNIIEGNPNVDTIPKEIWDVYRPNNWAEIGRKMDYSIAKGLRTSIHYSPSRQKLLTIAEFDNNEMIRTLATSDIFWDEIVMMEELEGEFTVCDISVPGTHNFIANDIIVHNSYTGGVVGEEITLLPKAIRNNLSVLMIDTMGIYWSMKRPNMKDADILREWGLKPQGMKVKLFVPKGFVEEYEKAGVEVDSTFSLSCGELTGQDWIITFGFSLMDDYGIAIERVIRSLKKRFGDLYSIEDIIKAIEADGKTDKKVKNSLIARFSNAENWGIFEKSGTPVKSIFSRGTVTVVDVSHFARTSTDWSVKGLLVGILSRKIFQERLMARKGEEFDVMAGGSKDTIPMVWLIADEAHQFLPAEGASAALEPMLTLIKEGREPGISLLLITQMPKKLHQEALAQADIVISHRMTAQADIEALQSVMQTYMMKDMKEYINTLPRQVGVAIVLDDNQERIYPIQVKPRMSWHAGGSPTAMKKKGLFD